MKRRNIMLYTALTRKAMIFAYKAHEGQLDRGGVPYVFHPYHLAEQMDSEYEICTALPERNSSGLPRRIRS